MKAVGCMPVFHSEFSMSCMVGMVRVQIVCEVKAMNDYVIVNFIGMGLQWFVVTVGTEPAEVIGKIHELCQRMAGKKGSC